jgi:uncharacterized damage-inducible protein DinB
MDIIFGGFFDLLQQIHEDSKAAIEGLTQDELDWIPGEGMNSMAVLAAHIAGSETFWIGDIVMGQPSGRDRPAEFATSGINGETLSDLLDGSLSRIALAFESMSVEQLHETRQSPRGGDEFTVVWAIGHVLEHTALHLGHMQVTRQLLGLPEDN